MMRRNKERMLRHLKIAACSGRIADEQVQRDPEKRRGIVAAPVRQRDDGADELIGESRVTRCALHPG